MFLAIKIRERRTDPSLQQTFLVQKKSNDLTTIMYYRIDKNKTGSAYKRFYPHVEL